MRFRWGGVAVVAGGLAAFLACTSFGEEDQTTAAPDAGGPDAAPDTSQSDGAPLPPCFLEKPFGPYAPLKDATPLAIETARPIGADPNDIISSACTPGVLNTCDLYRTNLADLGAVDAGRLGTLSQGRAEESFASVRLPSNQVLFARGEVDGGPATPRGLWAAASPEASPRKLDIAPPSVSDKEPYVIGNTVFFIRMIGGTGRVWSVALHESSSPTGNAKELQLPFQGNLYTPVVSDDREEVFVVVEQGNPRFALKAAHRVEGTEGYIEVNPFTALPGDPVVYPVWLSPDRCSLWVVTKASGSTLGRVQVLSRPKR